MKKQTTKFMIALKRVTFAIALCFSFTSNAGFDIWLYPLAFDKSNQTWSIGSGKAITKNYKYNNQPNFTLDGKALLFASNKSGEFNDIYNYDIESQSITSVTSTLNESEYSPTETNLGITYVIEQGVPHQSVWFNQKDKMRKRAIKSLIPAGYYATHESLGTLIWARYASDLYFEPKGENANENHFIAANVGRSLHRIPHEDSFSYLHNQGDGEAVIKRFNPITLSHTSLVKTTGASQDYAWSNKHWLFNFKENNLRTWQYNQQQNNYNTDWKSIAQLTPPKGYKLANRLAISPTNKLIAIVWQTIE
jgi:hypothetical protein